MRPRNDAPSYSTERSDDAGVALAHNLNKRHTADVRAGLECFAAKQAPCGAEKE